MENPASKIKRPVKKRTNYYISPSVFDKIFSFLEAPDLCNCRLVCRQWAETSKKSLGRTGYVSFDSLEKLETFIEVFENRPDFYKNFIFEGPLVMQPSILHFFNTFGPQSKCLIIRQCIWLGRNLFAIMKNTPNLEKLTIVGRVSSVDRLYIKAISDEDLVKGVARVNWSKLKFLTLDLGGYAEDVQHWNFRSDSGKIHPFIFQLMLAAPNVEKINCPSLEPSFSKVVLHIMLLRDELKLRKLGSIDFRTRVTNFELRYLEVKDFPLTSFALDVHPDISLNVLHNLLSSLGSTLKHLKLRFIERGSVTSHYFPSSPYLVKLKELALHRFNGSLLFTYDLTALEEIFLDDVCLKTLFSGPRGEPLAMPTGFRFDAMYLDNGGLRCTRDRSFFK